MGQWASIHRYRKQWSQVLRTQKSRRASTTIASRFRFNWDWPLRNENVHFQSQPHRLQLGDTHSLAEASYRRQLSHAGPNLSHPFEWTWQMLVRTEWVTTHWFVRQNIKSKHLPFAENMNIVMLTKTHLYEKGGHVFYNVTSTKIDYTIDGLKLRLDNLFDGVKVLGETQPIRKSEWTN